MTDVWCSLVYLLYVQRSTVNYLRLYQVFSATHGVPFFRLSSWVDLYDFVGNSQVLYELEIVTDQSLAIGWEKSVFSPLGSLFGR